MFRSSVASAFVVLVFAGSGGVHAQPTVTLIKKIARSFDAALELLQARMPEFVRNDPAIDKEKILLHSRAECLDGSPALDEEALRKCGLEVKQNDEFWIETAASKDLEAAAKKLKAA